MKSQRETPPKAARERFWGAPEHREPIRALSGHTNSVTSTWAGQARQRLGFLTGNHCLRPQMSILVSWFQRQVFAEKGRKIPPCNAECNPLPRDYINLESVTPRLRYGGKEKQLFTNIFNQTNRNSSSYKNYWQIKNSTLVSVFFSVADTVSLSPSLPSTAGGGGTAHPAQPPRAEMVSAASQVGGQMEKGGSPLTGAIWNGEERVQRLRQRTRLLESGCFEMYESSFRRLPPPSDRHRGRRQPSGDTGDRRQKEPAPPRPFLFFTDIRSWVQPTERA